MGNPTTGGKAFAPPQQRAAPATNPAQGVEAVDFGSNADRATGLCDRDGATLAPDCRIALGTVIDMQILGVTSFAAIARAAETPSLTEAVLAQIAVGILTGGAALLAGYIAPIAAAAGLSATAAAVLEGAYRASIVPASRAVAPALSTALAGAPDEERIDGFCDALTEALVLSKMDRGMALNGVMMGLDDAQLCALKMALIHLAAAAKTTQYQSCLEQWSSADRGQSSDGRERCSEITVTMAIDAHDPEKTARVTGASCPELAGMFGMLAGHRLSTLGLQKTLAFPGVEVQLSADNEVIGIDASAEGREVLRRLGAGAEDRSLWQATTGPIGDSYSELHVQNGASRLFGQWVGGRTLAELGVA
jgi:hypothetical protein